MQNDEKVLEQVGETSRIYEVGYHLVPMIPLEQVANHATEIKALITKNKGAILSDGEPKMVELAYMIPTMIAGVKHRCTSAYFGWVKFECEPEEAMAIEKAIKADENILRYLLVKTVRENTMVDKKLFMETAEEKGGEAKAAAPVEAPKPEVKAEAKPEEKWEVVTSKKKKGREVQGIDRGYGQVHRQSARVKKSFSLGA